MGKWHRRTKGSGSKRAKFPRFRAVCVVCSNGRDAGGPPQGHSPPAFAFSKGHRKVNCGLDCADVERVSKALKKAGRQSLVSIGGSLISAVVSFALVWLATTRLGKDQAGVLLLAVALFNIAARVALMGTATGLVRSISQARATGHTGDIPDLLRWGLTPVAVLGTVLAGLLMLFAPQIAPFLANDINPEDLEATLRASAPFLPAAALMFAVLGATRGFTRVKPTVMIDRIGRPLLQLVAIGIAIAFGVGTRGWTIAWLAPYVAALVLGALALNELRNQRVMVGRNPEVTRAAFWKFTTPQWGVDLIRVMVRWQDTLLIGILLGPGDAAIYSAVTRLVKLASMVNQSLVETVTPQISTALANDDLEEAGSLYQASTAWLVVGVFPVYLTSALYAGPLAEIFGEDFRAGASALVILSIGRLLGTATGPVEAVLTMSGRSGKNLGNQVASLVVNIGLTLLLVPLIGLPGAALAWVASILVNNYAPYFQVRKSTGLHPFGQATLTATAVVVLAYIIPAAIIHSLTDPGLLVALAGALFSGLVVVAWAAKNKGLLALDQLLRRRGSGGTAKTQKPATAELAGNIEADDQSSASRNNA